MKNYKKVYIKMPLMYLKYRMKNNHNNNNFKKKKKQIQIFVNIEGLINFIQRSTIKKYIIMKLILKSF